MTIIIFLAAAVITVITAVKLSTYADVIGERTSLGGLLVGTLLLAGATSLPEVTTSLTAVYLDNPDIAVSNVFGSNLFNIFILGLVDLAYRRKQMMHAADPSQIKTAWLSLMLTALMLIAILIPTGITFLGAGVEMYLLVALYAAGMYFLSKNQLQTSTEPTEDFHLEAISLRHAKWGFAVSALVIFVAGSVLSITGDMIAASTGISSSFVGTFMIAGATSLPELVTVIVAIQLANYNLAIGNILGSNVFNILILVLIDFAFRSGAVLSAVAPVTIVTASAVLLLNLFVIGAIMIARSKKYVRFYGLPSALVIIMYFACSYIIYACS
ncbi:sodium:calcium antiporter [Alkalicoccus daliensis]|uniref:Cation:H+ antiporter n=1 Tax=Alkalicoccus daliensis TaxID=745820 RepID=A0A1G9ZFU3_9BACI|nr:sodium:calcium antiporter [Alkalicoccus daliensis]SDN19841.1 cation:H+ antiporter [Alkalicoccus daliensis]